MNVCNCLIDLDNDDSNNGASNRGCISLIMFAATIIRLEFNCSGPEKGRLDVGMDGLSAESVQGASLTLERVDDIHGGDSLALGVLRVRDGVADDVL